MNVSANFTFTASSPGSPSVLATPVLSKDSRHLIETACYAGVVSLLCLFGIPANILTALVFWRQGLADRTNLCLFSLAVVDCWYLLCAFAVYSAGSLIGFYSKVLGEEYSSKAFSWAGGVMYGLRTTSGCINMIVALERCACVVLPLHAASLMRTRSMAALVVLSFVLAQAGYAVMPFCYRPFKQVVGNQVQWMFTPTMFFVENMAAMYTYIYTVLGAALFLIILLVICIATSVTVVTLRLAVTWRQKAGCATSDNTRQQRGLTAMLVMLSCVYIITMAPFAVRQCSFWFLTACLTNGVCGDLFHALTAIVHTVSLINCCVHIVIYYRRSSKFRSVLRRLFFDIKQPPTSVMSTSVMSTSVMSTAEVCKSRDYAASVRDS